MNVSGDAIADNYWKTILQGFFLNFIFYSAFDNTVVNISLGLERVCSTEYLLDWKQQTWI